MINNANDARNIVISHFLKQGYVLEEDKPYNHDRHYFLRFSGKDDWTHRYWLKFDRQPFIKPFESIQGFPLEMGESINSYWFNIAKARNCIFLFANPDIIYSIPWQQFEASAFTYRQEKGEIVHVIPISKLQTLIKIEGSNMVKV